MEKHQEVLTCLEQDLSSVSFDELDIRDNVRQQVKLVLAQFRRASGRTDATDADLYKDLTSLYNNDVGAVEDPSAMKRLVMKRLVKQLHLTGITDLTQESMALRKMVSSEDLGESREKISMLLKRIEEFVQTSVSMPNQFRCPLSLELMKDPVIISTGQTYERSFIEAWLGAGNHTCPKTKESLTSTKCIPNAVLRELIVNWCQKNGMDSPEQATQAASGCTMAQCSMIKSLLTKLKTGSPNVKKNAAAEIRSLAKINDVHRVEIARAGGIPLLAYLLTAPDSCAQVEAVTALLNLSLCVANKRVIIASGAVPMIVQVLSSDTSSMEARANAAATIFSLSIIDEYRKRLEIVDAIPPLVRLLSDGTLRGKKDAAAALHSLCIYHPNKGVAVTSFIIPTLMKLLSEPESGLKNEVLTLLDLLSSHPEAKVAIGEAKAVHVLVEFIRSGSPSNQENAAAVLVNLCSGDKEYLIEAQGYGLRGILGDLQQNGTRRGKRLARQLLKAMTD